jgi:hypothetical protein
LPKIRKPLPKEALEHLSLRQRQRYINMDDLLRLMDWVSRDPTVPDGDWFIDFGKFKLCGRGEVALTFLTSAQKPWGDL